MLDTAKIKWLNTMGIEDTTDVIDCDPQSQEVTFKIGDTKIVRRVCERWTRVMGYHRPVHAFNKGKQAEHAERTFFREPSGLATA